MATLGQNYPNPFNPSTTVPFTVGASGAGKPVTVSFYDVTGRLVERFNLGPKPVGSFTFRWNPALNGRGNVTSGVYYCRLQVDKEIYTRTMILLR
jgi:flagellar hook assembly protein FlgD